MMDATKITDIIYLGSAADAINTQWLSSNNITLVISFMTMSELAEYGMNKDFYTNKNIIWCHFDIDDTDSAPISLYFHLYEYIASYTKLNKNILIHCHHGISRSSTVLAAYMMQDMMWTRREAIEYIAKRRPIICPNDGFMDKLKELEITLLHNRSLDENDE